MARTRTTQEPSLVLPARRVSSTAPQTFPPFPGRYTPGVPVALSAIGLTEAEATAAVKELGLPLEFVKVAARGDDETSEE